MLQGDQWDKGRIILTIPDKEILRHDNNGKDRRGLCCINGALGND